jgi:hypothetical protein
VDAAMARSRDQYLTLEAEEAFDRFMPNQWPDDKLFSDVVTELIARVPAFGETVALLWARDHQVATVRREYPWHQTCKNQAFPLFYAYPRQDLPRRIDKPNLRSTL